MDGKIKQRVCIKFCVKLGKSATKILEILREAFRERSLSRMVVFEWHSRFKAGQVSAEGDERLDELADTVGITYGVCQVLTENMNMGCTAMKFVPRLLTNDQKQRHINVCLEL
jgi:hypothetical protein